MEKQKTIIYGGAFNPPTVAHETILQACADYARDNESDLWLMPSGDRLDKQIPTSRDMRLKYIDAMLEELDSQGVKLHIVTAELDRLSSVQTIDTVNEFSQTYPTRKFIWVFGADSVATMAEWKGGAWMLDNLDMLVIGRRGYAINNLAKRATQLVVSVPDTSSTQVREYISRGQSVEGLVSSAVARILFDE
jgi:nicotinate-nucleotide adenylyltransferase